MVKMNYNNYRSMIENSPVKTILSEYTDLHQNTVGIMILDVLENSLSAVYSFYDVKKSNQSLGVYMILDTIKLSKELNLKYLYLGYAIKNNNKMNYKFNFKPYETFVGGKWI